MVKHVQARVRNILEKYEQTRDDAMKLFAYMILDTMNFNKNYISSLTAEEIIFKIYNNKVPHFTSILRCRQKLQEEVPELRGKLYEKRKKHSEVVKQEIKDFKPETNQKSLFA